jgi:hypothetical protein
VTNLQATGRIEAGQDAILSLAAPFGNDWNLHDAAGD